MTNNTFREIQMKIFAKDRLVGRFISILLKKKLFIWFQFFSLLILNNALQR